MPPLDNSSFLDQQFAALLLRICANEHYALSEPQQQQLAWLAAYTSQATRQGIIAAKLPSMNTTELTVLLNSPAIGHAGDYAPLIIENDHIWLNRYWQYEQHLAQNIVERLKIKLTLEQTALQNTLNTWFPASGNDLQKQAVERAASLPFLIISGGPGTGKTTTVTRLLCLLIEHFKIHPQRIKLAAPTGKAAMRMQEAIRQAKTNLQLAPELAELIPEQGSTLHRLLGYIPGKVGFRHHTHYPLPADVVIVDEASMIDISLMSHLFAAVRPDARLILLGDRDQLASVETGSIFRDLCASDQSAHPLNEHIVVLEKSWRFDASGGIGQLAKAVRDQQEQTILDILQLAPKGVTWDQSTQISTTYFQQVWRAYLVGVQAWQQDIQQLPALFAAFNQFRLLTPLRKGSLGTEQLNQQLSTLLRRSLPNRFQGAWFAGRPIMITENDYRQNLFNGDIGLTLPETTGQLRVWFPEPNGGFRAFAPVRLPAHETAWAMTIHKSQGSEFENVLLVMPEDAEAKILGRELLYTGITRARSQLDLMGKETVILAAVRRSLPATSCLRWRIAAYAGCLSSS